MNDPVTMISRRIKRRRYAYYLLEILIVAGLIASGLLGFLLYNHDTAMAGLESSILLSIAIVCILIVPTRDLKRIESMVELASDHDGILTVEMVVNELNLPSQKVTVLINWLQKHHYIEKKAATNRWVFPEMRKRT